jgi:hypothetical protein
VYSVAFRDAEVLASAGREGESSQLAFLWYNFFYSIE